MADFSDKLGEIKTLLSSNSKANKPLAYSSLLHLQEHSNADPSYIQTLSQSSATILQSIIADIPNDDDEEIAALALKCLGFMVYHPVLVAAITEEDASSVIESLAKLITTTKLKSVCNLGVWCISIQQFNASLLAAHFQSLLRAVVHALDNPIGSLSTTFEAIQAVMKLETQLSVNIRDTSDVWAPPIYRRLLSLDKKERDISERCLLKIRSTILPSPSNLSKVLVLDMKQKLLFGMKELLQHGMKVQTMQAWGWFIRLLGSHATKNRNLVNEMLKIPERAFSDHDPQFQTAALVAWEGVIDALIHPLIRGCEENIAMENGIQHRGTCKDNCNRIHADKSLKSIKLIMTPLVGIMSSKCDVAVHSACLNTWCYLLHKLDTSVTNPSVIKAVLEPIFVAVFQTKPNNKNIWSWKLCLDLLGDFILAKSRNVDYDSNSQTINHISGRATILGKCSWNNYSIKWFPWDITQSDFHMKIINILISQGATTDSSEYRSFAFDAALSLFRSVLKGIHIELKSSSVNYDETMLCLNMVLQFVKKICEDVTSKDNGNSSLHPTPLRFIEAVAEELELSILGSPLYKVALDLKYIDNFQSVNEIRHVKVLAISSIAYMDMVSPLVYITILYFSVVAQRTLHAVKMEFILQEMQKYLKLLLSSNDSLESLHAVISLLFKHIDFSCLKIWITISVIVKEYIDGAKDLSQLKLEAGSTGFLAFCHLLTYPFIVYSFSEKGLPLVKVRASPDLSLVSSLREFELQHVIEVWKSLYGSVTRASKFDCSAIDICTENLCLMLNNFIDESTSTLECNTELCSSDENWDHNLLALVGNVVICVMENISSLEMREKENKYNDGGDCKGSSHINTVLGLSARFMMLSWMKKEADQPAALPLMSRVLSALTCFIGCLHLKQDIQSFIEILSRPLLQQLSCVEEQDESTLHQLQLLWTETLNSLLRNQPPIIFDSSFLKLQAPLLEITLDHPNPSISKSTITFWNSTYSQQAKLNYPQCLLHVLDKLSRNGKINLRMRCPPFLGKCNSRLLVGAAPQGYRVTATHNRRSKRVELIEDTVGDCDHDNELLSPSMKRKKLELTEHQKEVRRAQQGRERDCSGHGPGIRTYTSVDFSQGNDESQDSEDIRNPESILEILRRAG